MDNNILIEHSLIIQKNYYYSIEQMINIIIKIIKYRMSLKS